MYALNPIAGKPGQARFILVPPGTSPNLYTHSSCNMNGAASCNCREHTCVVSCMSATTWSSSGGSLLQYVLKFLGQLYTEPSRGYEEHFVSWRSTSFTCALAVFPLIADVIFPTILLFMLILQFPLASVLTRNIVLVTMVLCR